MFCVAGLLAANVFFSIGAIRLPRLFPDQVKNAPFPIKKFWLYPSGVLGAIFSLAFAGMAFYFFQPIILITGCTQTAEQTTHTTIKETIQHPNQHLNHTITITATLTATTDPDTYTLTDQDMLMLFMTTNNQTIRTGPLINQATYTITGILHYGTVDTGTIQLENKLYLEATTIK
jgi:hypothetical protein